MPEEYAAKAKEAGYLVGRLKRANERKLALARLRVLYPDIEFTYGPMGLQLIVSEGRMGQLSRAMRYSADRIYVKQAADGNYRLIKDRHGVPGPPYKEPEETPQKSVWEWLRNPAV